VKRILIVEDEASIAHLISYNLEQAGYLVMRANDGLEALRLIEDFSPHLVTLDLLLPRQSGWEVLDAIRRHPRRQIATVPVIVLSALCSPHLQEELRRSDIRHCLGKPFSVMELCLLVQTLLTESIDTALCNPL
jgi:two-component system alkaline phosphatase synthesis response regulator PhoP